jgi:hypothetical protein
MHAIVSSITELFNNSEQSNFVTVYFRLISRQCRTIELFDNFQSVVLIIIRSVFAILSMVVLITPPRWFLNVFAVRSAYANDPKGYARGSFATGKAALVGQMKG